MSRYLSLLQSDVGVMVLELGANDGLQGVDVATMERNLNAMVEAAQSHGVRVLLCGMETPPLRSLSYSVAFHDVFPRVARRYNIPLVPFLLTGVALIPEMNGPDGIHPNAAGARRIADNVWPYLEPLLHASAASAATR
jgi:acyl-CoA thioesterase-1